MLILCADSVIVPDIVHQKNGRCTCITIGFTDQTFVGLSEKFIVIIIYCKLNQNKVRLFL